MQGNLFIITGPSGVGKDTLISRLMSADNHLHYSVSATTRQARPGEIDGKSYYFLSKEQFENKIKQGEFLEYAEYVGNYYGTLESPVNEKLQQGFDVLLIIELQGALQVHEKRPDAIMLFIAPPSFEELERRLVTRGTESKEKIQQRLETAKIEISYSNKFNHIIVNDNIERAVEELHNIIQSYRQ